MRSLKSIIYVQLVASVLFGCNIKSLSNSKVGTKAAATTPTEKVSVSAAIAPKNSSSTALFLSGPNTPQENADSFVIDILGCNSTWDKQVAPLTNAASRVNLVVGDTGCFSALSQFTFNGVIYVPKGDNAFANQATSVTSATQIFWNKQTGADEIDYTVTLLRQLPNQIPCPTCSAETLKVQYYFQGISESEISGNGCPCCGVSAGPVAAAVSGGIPVKVFSIPSTLTAAQMLDVQMNGKIKFNLSCLGNDHNFCANTLINNNNEVTYMLITIDQFNTNNPNLTQLQSLNWAKGLNVQNDVVARSSFATVAMPLSSLIAPTAIAGSNGQFILVVMIGNKSTVQFNSFQSFIVTIHGYTSNYGSWSHDHT